MAITQDPSKGERPVIISCAVFGGRSPKTGKKVGARHRWADGEGVGRCEFCGRYREDVLSKPLPSARTVDQIVSDGR